MATQTLLTLWKKVDATAHHLLAPIENDDQYEEALVFMAELWDKVEQDDNSPYGSLLSIVIKNIAAYEETDTQQFIPDASPVQVLTYVCNKLLTMPTMIIGR